MLCIEAITRSRRYPSLLDRDTSKQCEEFDSYTPTDKDGSHVLKGDPVDSDRPTDAYVEQQNGKLD